jgi:glycopeptide antibiotics resistance protein
LVHAAALAVVTLLPIRWNRRLARWPTNYKPQLVPFDGIMLGFRTSPLETLAEAFGNVLLFAPFGFLLPLLVPAMRRWWRAGATAGGASHCPSTYTRSPSQAYAGPMSTTC